ncbi:MAG: LysE family transporter [Anaerolineales bacterium]|nr:LysE family transporter [Anaerolineales bacterium]MCK5633440.1 LysE family transporter [Anaerolineales bacterium]
MSAFLEGVLAGYGIAIPVGAIAVLILDVSLRHGFRAGFMAGAGAAFADFLYAALAVIAGGALVQIISPYAVQVKVISGVVLLAVGLYGLMRSIRPSEAPEAGSASSNGSGKVFAQFLGLTFINPLTIVYFSALILGGGAKSLASVLERVAFVIGAGLASISWQTLLAGLGALGHERLSPRFQIAVSILGFLVVIGFGLRILLPLV